MIDNMSIETSNKASLKVDAKTDVKKVVPDDSIHISNAKENFFKDIKKLEAKVI